MIAIWIVIALFAVGDGAADIADQPAPAVAASAPPPATASIDVHKESRP